MKIVVTGIKVEGVTPSFSQMSELSSYLCTRNIENNGSLKIRCAIRKQPFDVRFKVAEILKCSTSQIYTEYHEKD